MPSVALATCAAFADGDGPDRLIIGELAARGVDAQPAVWDADVDWAAFDLVVLRSTWDYTDRVDQFRDWLDRVEAATVLANPSSIVRWNTDKRYLADLAAAGVPVIPTTFLAPGDDVALPDIDGDLVVKPTVSAGSRDTARYTPTMRADAAAHAEALLAAGRHVMVQPYLDAVDVAGETAVIVIDGTYSHAIRKGPLLRAGEDPERVAGLFLAEDIRPRTPSEAERALATEALAAVPVDGPLLYARVDLISDSDGSPRVIELELTEPSLFLDTDPDAAATLADAITRRLEGA